MDKSLFTASDYVNSSRIIYTPSAFARSSLIHLQETGTLKALYPHKSERYGLHSYLFFTVVSGSGQLYYENNTYNLNEGDCVFIDCRKNYAHSTDTELWSLKWCHFFGPNMNSIYQKYQERGGSPVFKTDRSSDYNNVLDELYTVAKSADYVRDMKIHEKLSSLLVLLMEDAWDDFKILELHNTSTSNIQEIKDYLDTNFKDKISLDWLASHFYINKYYMQNLFKDCYGSTINAYLNQVRITYVKQQLRFTDKTIEALASELHIEPPYLSRLFKKIEGVCPSQFRLSWRGKD